MGFKLKQDAFAAVTHISGDRRFAVLLEDGRIAMHVGWSAEVTDEYSVACYFAGGEYLGPDIAGVEPLWEYYEK